MRHPKFVVFKDRKGEWRFNLKSANGKIIAVSEGYETKQGAENGVQAVINAVQHMSEHNIIVEHKE